MWETHIQYKLKKKFIVTIDSTVLIFVDFLAKYTISAILLLVLYIYTHTYVVSLNLIYTQNFINYSFQHFPKSLSIILTYYSHISYSFALIFQVHIYIAIDI